MELCSITFFVMNIKRYDRRQQYNSQVFVLVHVNNRVNHDLAKNGLLTESV